MKRFLIPLFCVIAIGFTSSSFKINTEALPTSIQVKVIDYVGNFVEGAAIKLFHSQEDYRNETNQIGDTYYSDKKGKATIKNLEPRVYFIYVTKDDMNNIGGGVQTDTLKSGKVNKINIIIE